MNTQNLDSNLVSALTFPVPEDVNVGWSLGQSFDPIKGTAGGFNGFEGKPSYIQSHLGKDFILEGYTFDSNSINTALNYTEKAHGHGWGVSANESMNESFAGSFSEQSITAYNYNAYNDYHRKIDVTNTKGLLTQSARSLLKKRGYEAFCNTYGTHFVSGLTYGTGIYLHYKMTFMNVTAKNNFSDSMSASEHELGTKASVSEKVNWALNATHLHYSVFNSASTFGYAIKNKDFELDDMKVIAQEYASQKANLEPTLISVDVLPWYVLDEVRQILKSDGKKYQASQLLLKQEVGEVYRNFVILDQGTNYFLNSQNKLYCGSQQFDAVSAVQIEVRKSLTAMEKMLSSINSDGKNYNPNKIDEFRQLAAKQTDDYSQAVSRFAVSWFIGYRAENDFTAELPLLDGSMPQVQENDKGLCYFTGKSWVNFPTSGPNQKFLLCNNYSGYRYEILTNPIYKGGSIIGSLTYNALDGTEINSKFLNINGKDWSLDVNEAPADQKLVSDYGGFMVTVC